MDGKKVQDFTCFKFASPHLSRAETLFIFFINQMYIAARLTKSNSGQHPTNGSLGAEYAWRI